MGGGETTVEQRGASDGISGISRLWQKCPRVTSSERVTLHSRISSDRDLFQANFHLCCPAFSTSNNTHVTALLPLMGNHFTLLGIQRAGCVMRIFCNFSSHEKEFLLRKGEHCFKFSCFILHMLSVAHSGQAPASAKKLASSWRKSRPSQHIPARFCADIESCLKEFCEVVCRPQRRQIYSFTQPRQRHLGTF